MSQNLTRLRRVFYGVETPGTEGTRVAGTATTAILPVSLSVKPDKTILPRSFIGQMGGYTGKPGEMADPSISMAMELRGSGLGTDATTIVTDIDELLKTVFGTKTADSGTSNGGTTVTSISGTTVTCASTTNFTAGNVVLIETDNGSDVYEACHIASITDGTHFELTAAPSSTVTGTASSKIKPTVTYSLANSGHQSLTFDIYDAANGTASSAQYRSFQGCKSSLKIEVPSTGAIPMASFDWHAISQTTATNGTVPSQTIGDTGTPGVALGGVFKIGSTRTDIRSFSFDLGAELARKKSHQSTYGTSAIVVANYKPKGSISLYNADYTQYSAWEAGTSIVLTYQCGTTLGNIVSLVCPSAQRMSVADGADSDLITDEINFDANLTSGLDMVYLAVG